MPPKRKAATAAVTETPAKAAKTPTSKAGGRKTTTKAATKPSTGKTDKANKTTVVEDKHFDPEKCYRWFKTYTGLEEDEDFDKEQIGPSGIAKLCEDIDVSLETVDMLVLAYHLEADTMPIFTKDEWAKGMKTLEIDSTQKLKDKMPSLVAKLKDPQHFKEFYRYIFMFAKDSEQKCMPLETACAMIQTVMQGNPHEKRFVEFLETKKPVKVINKDQWYNFLDFSDSVAEDLSNYDGVNSAWPVLLDEYVEWRNEESS
ncbi:DCN1-like protein 5 [Entomortierella chlamydospora]|uniref:Defective in cullin neddylation protein n=1 Tax=Entomortierella chlamydospora TaxID=101097 RepID=A0A9P6T1X1_9FUNG|nr:DCN1-like protein 5 [Entomortierella chlamydospora]